MLSGIVLISGFPRRRWRAGKNDGVIINFVNATLKVHNVACSDDHDMPSLHA